MPSWVKKDKFLTLEERISILELVQPEEIEVAVPVPPTDDRMTKKKKQPTITDFFSKQKTNKK